MDKKRLSRLLIDALTHRINLSQWVIKQVAEDAIDKAFQQTNEVDELVEQLHCGVVRFFYKKKDGTTREAYGTLKASLLRGFLGANESRKRCVTESVAYFDLEKEEWRCFSPENYLRKI